MFGSDAPPVAGRSAEPGSVASHLLEIVRVTAYQTSASTDPGSPLSACGRPRAGPHAGGTGMKSSGIDARSGVEQSWTLEPRPPSGRYSPRLPVTKSGCTKSRSNDRQRNPSRSSAVLAYPVHRKPCGDPVSSNQSGPYQRISESAVAIQKIPMKMTTTPPSRNVLAVAVPVFTRLEARSNIRFARFQKFPTMETPNRSIRIPKNTSNTPNPSP